MPSLSTGAQRQRGSGRRGPGVGDQIGIPRSGGVDGYPTKGTVESENKGVIRVGRLRMQAMLMPHVDGKAVKIRDRFEV